MIFSGEKLAGPGYVMLNIIRVLNIVGLLAVAIACALMLIKTQAKSAFFFFDAVTNVTTMISALYLIISELCLFPSHFVKSMPLLSPTHGFVALSLALFVLATTLLGELNHENTSQDVLGLAFWRVVLAAGILCFILSPINLVATFLFRVSALGITARQVRAHGATAAQMTDPTVGASTLKSVSREGTPSTTRTQQQDRNPRRPLSSVLLKPLRILPDPFRASPAPALPSYHSSANPRPRPPPLKLHTRAPTPHASTPPCTAADTMCSPTTPYTQGTRHPLSPSSRYSRLTTCSKKRFGFGGRDRRGATAGVYDDDEEAIPPLPTAAGHQGQKDGEPYFGSDARFSRWISGEGHPATRAR